MLRLRRLMRLRRGCSGDATFYLGLWLTQGCLPPLEVRDRSGELRESSLPVARRRGHSQTRRVTTRRQVFYVFFLLKKTPRGGAIFVECYALDGLFNVSNDENHIS